MREWDSNSRTQAIVVVNKMIFVNEGKIVLRYALLSASKERGEIAMNISAHEVEVDGWSIRTMVEVLMQSRIAVSLQSSELMIEERMQSWNWWLRRRCNHQIDDRRVYAVQNEHGWELFN